MLEDISLVLNNQILGGTLEYQALELVFEFICILCRQHRARYILCHFRRETTYQRDPPQKFWGKDVEVYNFY